MKPPLPEFSRIVSISRVPPKGLDESLEAKPVERKALSDRFSLVELSLLKAQLTLQPASNKTFVLTGFIEADVVQPCVVTLDPLTSHLKIPMNMILLPAESQDEEEGLKDLDDIQTETDVFVEGKIDLGEIVAQQLGIHIDPYPRRKDAALTKTKAGREIQIEHPFASLADALKTKKNKDK